MIRAFIKVDPDTGDVVSYGEGAVKFDENGDEIPLPDLSPQGYLQIEVEPGSWRDQFTVDFADMSVTRTPFDDSGSPSDQDDPAFIAAEDARRAKSLDRVATLGHPINEATRIHPRKQGKIDAEANNG